jgi:hypothetical protein
MKSRLLPYEALASLRRLTAYVMHYICLCLYLYFIRDDFIGGQKK